MNGAPPDGETISRSSNLLGAAESEEPMVLLTIVSHPDARRVGDEAWLPGLRLGQAASISRLEPIFAPPRGTAGWPLADPGLSRQPVLVAPDPAGVKVSIAPNGPAVRLAGEPFTGARVIHASQLADGVPLTVGRDVVLLLHTAPPPAERPPALGLVGECASIQQLRSEILRVADIPVPALIRGESGTGKELVAAAIHQESPRRDRPWEAVNMAALAPSTALSTLFGHVRGAFTGAVSDHPGCFVAAHESTLFLDEIGEAPAEVQTMLLRVLETGSFVPLGARALREVDVRVLAATDADLETAVSSGRFRAALLHRLEGYRLRVPPLRERRADIGRLLYTFLSEELGHLGEAARLHAEAGQRAWLPAALVEQSLVHPWPGNVRQLRNMARRLAIASRSRATAVIEDALPAVEPEATAIPAPAAANAKRKTATVGEAELLAALAENGWRIGPTARALGLPRSSLYMLIDRSPSIRKASQVPLAEIEETLARFGGDEEQAAAHLKVSPRGLKIRLGDRK